MGLMLNISKADLAKSIPIETGWKKFIIDTPYAKPSKDNQSVNYIVPHILADDPNGRVIEHNFNSKAIGMIAPFLAGLSGKPLQEVLAGIKDSTIDIDLESFKGKTIMGKVEHQMYEGRIMSRITDWCPEGKVPF